MTNILCWFIDVLSLAVTLSIFYVSIKKSTFGILLTVSMVWSIIGLFVYPIFDLLGLIDLNIEGRSFIETNGNPGILSAIHILFISVGMWCGYFFKGKYNNKGILERFSIPLDNINPLTIWRVTTIFSLLIIIFFYYLTGFETAIKSAAAARSGEFDGFEGTEQFMFLKTFSTISSISTAIFPIALLKKDRLFIFFYIILIALMYLNSISRSLVLSSIVIPITIYVRLSKISFKTTLAFISLIPIFYILLLYGKPFGQFISAYLNGKDYELIAQDNESGFLNAMLVGTGYQWYSVQAGINNFFNTGSPLFPNDVFLSIFFGMIPSHVLESLGYGDLYYGNANVRLACVNTEIFGLFGCTVPPTSFGYSSYLLPGAGGFILGFIMLRTYATIEHMWLIRQHRDVTKVWIPMMWFTFLSAMFSMIPTMIPRMEVSIIWVFFITYILSIKFRR